jgi:predicted Zn-dependent protease
VSQGKEVDYLRALVEAVRPQMQQAERYRRITTYLAQSPECEARSFPGGTLVFFRGLLEQAESEAAVVGIVGHELSHLDRGHHTLRARRVKLAEQKLAAGAEQFSLERFFSAGTSLARLWTRPFRPEDEAAADRDGALWAYASGYDPREMAKLFLRLHQQRPAPALVLPGFLQTHPAFENRAQAIDKLYEKLQMDDPKDRLYAGHENLRRRIPRSVRKLPP